MMEDVEVEVEVLESFQFEKEDVMVSLYPPCPGITCHGTILNAEVIFFSHSFSFSHLFLSLFFTFLGRGFLKKFPSMLFRGRLATKNPFK